MRCARRRLDHEVLARQDAPATSCCSNDPAEQISGKDELRVALSAMARLTKEHRESLRLVAHHGLTYDQAAARLGIPVGTVRSRTSRARAELKRLLTPTKTCTAPC
jgi:RNA polymerase sigma-70 factor (ECF subfamily)